MQENKVVITKRDNGTCAVELNGIKIDKVLDFRYEKNSATCATELTLKIDVDELEEVFK